MRILVEFEVSGRDELAAVLRAGREQTLYDARVERFVINPAQPQENKEWAENSPASPAQHRQLAIAALWHVLGRQQVGIELTESIMASFEAELQQ